ncbi:MAG: GNAT family N-acetyltransferase [Chitinophagaceae bacterium]
MPDVIFREVTVEDVPYLAKIRGEDLESEKFWNDRILGYIKCIHHPQQALNTRIIYVAILNGTIVGFIAGHLTGRYKCDGELQWINVMAGAQRIGIASRLVKVLAKWFISKKSHKVCVDPGNEIAIKFYQKNGAKMLNNHWMFWEDIGTTL